MTQKITHIIEKDRHGHVKHDVPITVPITSEEGDSELLAMSQKGASDIAASTRDKITDLVVVDRDGTPHSKTHTDPETGEKVAILQADEIGKIDGVSVNGEELEVDANGKVHLTIPESVTDLKDADDYATKEDAQAMVDEAKVTGASVDYKEDGGSPSASVDFNEGSLGFTMKNMKMKFSDLTPEERALLKGEQGRPGTDFQPIEDVSGLDIAQAEGDSETAIMSQKAVTDGIASVRAESLVEVESIGASSYPNISQYISVSSGKWASVSGYSGKIIPVTPGDIYRLQAASGKTAIYALLATDSHVVGDDPDYYGETSIVQIAIDAVVTLEIPQGAFYLYVLSLSSNKVFTPTIYRLTKANDSIKDIEDDIKEISFVEKRAVNVNGYATLNRYIAGDTNKWAYSTEITGVVIPVTAGETLRMTTDANIHYAFLKAEDTQTVNTEPLYAGGAIVRSLVLQDKTKIVKVPSDATKLYVNNKVNSASVDVSISIMDSVKDEVERLSVGVDEAKSVANEARYLKKSIDLSVVAQTTKYISSQNKWASYSGTGGKFLSVKPGEMYGISSDSWSCYAFLTAENDLTDGRTPEYAGEQTERIPISANEERVLVVPNLAVKLFVLTKLDNVYRNIVLSRLTPINDELDNLIKDGPYMMPVDMLDEYSGNFNEDGTPRPFDPSGQYYGTIWSRKYALEQGKEYYVTGRIGSLDPVPSVAYYDSEDEFISFDPDFVSTGTAFAYFARRLNVPDEAAFVIVRGANQKIGIVPAMPMLYEGLWQEKRSVTPYVIEYHEAKIRSNFLTSDKDTDPTSATKIEDTYANSGWAVMWPSSYTQHGKPTRVIAMLHGASGYVTNTVMGYTNTTWVNWRNRYINEGYAVIDVNGYGVSSSSDEYSLHYGCPMAVETLDKAFEYLKKYYNVADKMLIHGTSMGGLLAQTYTKAYPGNVLAVGLFASMNLMAAAVYLNTSETFAQVWGYESFDDIRADNYNNFVGHAPFAKCLAWHNGELSEMDWSSIDNSEPRNALINRITTEYGLIEYFPVPIREWQGLSDTTIVPSQGKQIIEGYRRGGSVASIRLVQGANHDMCTGSTPIVIEEAVAWFKRMEG